MFFFGRLRLSKTHNDRAFYSLPHTRSAQLGLWSVVLRPWGELWVGGYGGICLFSRSLMAHLLVHSSCRRGGGRIFYFFVVLVASTPLLLLLDFILLTRAMDVVPYLHVMSWPMDTGLGVEHVWTRYWYDCDASSLVCRFVGRACGLGCLLLASSCPSCLWVERLLCIIPCFVGDYVYCDFYAVMRRSRAGVMEC